MFASRYMGLQVQLCSCCGQNLNSSGLFPLYTCLVLKAGRKAYEICFVCLRPAPNPKDRNYRRRWSRWYKKSPLAGRRTTIFGASCVIFHGEYIMEVIK